MNNLLNIILSLYSQPSNFAVGVDRTFYFIIGICVVLFVLITSVMILFVVKYNRKRNPQPTQIKEKLWLELTWIIIPVIIVLAMFYYGYVEYDPMLNPPKNALKINVEARQWEWKFIYANGKESKQLYVPYKRSILLNLKSLDVIHSLSIPAFRIKEDIVPGKKDNFLWFIPTIKDTFELYCSSYCGISHSYMLSKVIVLSENDYNNWYSQVQAKSASEQMPGYKLLKDNACLSCHSLDGNRLIGPTYKGLFGSEVIIIENGKEKKVKADENFLKSKILGIEKGVVKTYPAGVMRPYKDFLKDEQIKQIIDYLKTLK